MPESTTSADPETPRAPEPTSELRPRWRRWLPVGLTLVTGGCLSLLAFSFAAGVEENRAIAVFRLAADERLFAVEENIRSNIESLEALAAFYAGSDSVERNVFAAFTAPILARHPGIRALEWAPRVRLEDRAAFEREIRQSGLPEFQITERAETNEMVRASSRKEYFPVLYVEPLEDNLSALGFDLGSVANRKATIERAAKSGLAMATGRIRLVQEPGGFSTLVLSPVYRAGASLDTDIERRDALKGFVIGVFSLNKMLGAPSADVSEGLSPFALDLHIVDEQASAGERLLHFDNSEHSGALNIGDEEAAEAALLSGVRKTHKIFLAGRNWSLVATPTGEPYRVGTQWLPWGVLFAGMAFTILAAVYLIFILNRTHTIARLVGQRTRELVLSNENLAAEVRIRTEAQDRLARSEHHIRTIIDAVGDGIVTLSSEGTVETVNKAACKMFGREPQEITGQYLKILIADEKELRPFLTGDVSADRGSISAEITGRRRDGTTFPMEVSLTAMRFDQEKKYVATLRDITERKKIDRLKNEFVSTVSHELRTPLTSINGALGLIDGGLAGEIPEKARELIDIARRNGDRLVRLINDILDIEKMESGEAEIDFRPLPVMEVIERAIRANVGFAAQFGVELRITESLPGVEVYAGRDQLMQILTNLISNAAKFSPRSGTVELAVVRAGPWVRFSVTDHGEGISPEFQPRVFSKFSQADSSNTRQAGGTGLGLNICKTLVELHGGRIDFTTQAGKGTTFHFDLPEWTPESMPASQRAASQ